MGQIASGGEAASNAENWAPKPGEVVGGKFVVEHVLGVGGMGIVVAARHAHLDQRVAIKFLRRDAARDEAAVARFLREARAVAILQSEHVVRVMDAGRLDDGLPYLVMEHLTGTDLDQLLTQRGPLPLEEAVGYLLQAMEAVAEAHAAGIVHRDLKPSNLFVTTRSDGSSLVKVLDFGISKALDATSSQMSLTATSVTLGSPLYMSPEQVRSSKNVDVRIDVWALGVIAYELLAGAPPFEAETVTGLCAKIVADEPVSLRSRRPDLDPAFEAIVLRCLEKNVAARYQSVHELAAALQPFASVEGRVSAARIGRIGGGPRPTLPSVAPPNPQVISSPVDATSADADVGYAETVASWQSPGGRSPRRVKTATAAILGGLAIVASIIAVARWPRAVASGPGAGPGVSAAVAGDGRLPSAPPEIAPSASPAPPRAVLSDLPAESAPTASGVASTPEAPSAAAPPVSALPGPSSASGAANASSAPQHLAIPPHPLVQRPPSTNKPAAVGPAPKGKTPDDLLLDRK